MIGSMGLVYLPTRIVDVYGINVGKYTSPMHPRCLQCITVFKSITTINGHPFAIFLFTQILKKKKHIIISFPAVFSDEIDGYLPKATPPKRIRSSQGIVSMCPLPSAY